MTTDIGEVVGVDPEDIAGGTDDVREVMACDFPLLVWQFPRGVVQLGNQPATELFGLTHEQLIGTAAADLIGPTDVVGQAITMFESGALDNAHGERWVRSRTRPRRRVRVWTRAIHVDGSRAAVSLVVPVEDLGRLGRDPAAPWRDLTPVAVGMTDARLRIVAVSSDIRDVLGFKPDDLLGKSLHDIVQPDEQNLIGDFPHETSVSHRRVPAQRADGAWVELCVLVAAIPTPQAAGVMFALIASPGSALRPRRDRIAELEHRLKIIGAEVRGAGVLEGAAGLLSVADHPRLRQLSLRQWEILSRLAQGERVPTIAADLYVSASTVRNHLASIFQKFGVHSQVELLAALRRHRR